MKTYLVGEGKVGLLRSFMYCQSTLSLYHKTADRSSIYWSQCSCDDFMILGMLKYLNLLISENDIFKDTAGVITSVALKATVSRRDSCDLEADKVKDEITNVNSAQCEY